MKIILETPRLICREFTVDDGEQAYLLNADAEVLKYTGDSPFESIEAAKTFLENYPDYKKNGFGRWAVIRKDDEQFLGWCGLKSYDGIVDIGYRFAKRFWNQGYATESAAACMEYGFSTLQLREIIGRAEKENIASIRVFHKLDMQFLKEEILHGHNMPCVIYSKTSPYITN